MSSLILCVWPKNEFFVRVHKGGTSCAMIGIESFVASFVVTSVKAIAGRNADKPL